jgi:hypothetical protein
MILDGQFTGNKEQVDHYRAKLAPLLIDSETIPLYNREVQIKSPKLERKNSFSKKDLPPKHMKLCPGMC